MPNLDIGSVTLVTAGTRVQFGTDTAPFQTITAKARPRNASLVYVGLSTVTSTSGMTLDVGEQFEFRAGNTNAGGGIQLAQLYMDGDVAADRVDFFAYSD